MRQYNKEYKKHLSVNGERTHTSVTDERVKEPVRKPVSYIYVTNCKKLNIREKPSLESKVISIKNESDRLIEGPRVNLEWTSVLLEDSRPGYVMSKFVEKRGE